METGGADTSPRRSVDLDVQLHKDQTRSERPVSLIPLQPTLIPLQPAAQRGQAGAATALLLPLSPSFGVSC